MAPREKLRSTRPTDPPFDANGPTRGSSICQPGSRTRQLSLGKALPFLRGSLARPHLPGEGIECRLPHAGPTGPNVQKIFWLKRAFGTIEDLGPTSPGA